MSAASYACYGHLASGASSRAHVLAAVPTWQNAMPTAAHVPADTKRSFIEDATAHRRVPEVLLT